MRILHVTSLRNQNGNGVAVAVTKYFEYERRIADVAVFNMEDNFISDSFSYSAFNYKNISSLPDGFNAPDLVIFIEIYKSAYLKLYRECINNKIPYIIIPHGCLTSLAQNRKRIKKKIANFLLFNKFIKNSLAIQYLSEYEKDNSIKSNHKFVISGNGIDAEERNKNFRNKNFIYIGRYSIEHKGLDLLVDTVVANKKWFLDNDVRVVLYGRDSNNDYKRLRDLIMTNNVSEIIILNDAVYGDEKKKILSNAYAFIQPSRWEGQPMGLLEALSFGLPCIVTFGTSFGEYINNNRCGIGINFDQKELFGAIKKIFDDVEFRNECAKNTKIANDDYGWESVTRKCLMQYEGLI